MFGGADDPQPRRIKAGTFWTVNRAQLIRSRKGGLFLGTKGRMVETSLRSGYIAQRASK
jgi:hypothetical protein